MTDDEDTERHDLRSGPPATLIALYRALSTSRRECHLLQRATSERDHAMITRAADEATYRWLGAKAALQRLRTRDSENSVRVDAAQAAVDDSACILMQLLRTASRQASTPALRKTLRQLRLCLTVATAPPPTPRVKSASPIENDAHEHHGELDHAQGS